MRTEKKLPKKNIIKNCVQKKIGSWIFGQKLVRNHAGNHSKKKIGKKKRERGKNWFAMHFFRAKLFIWRWHPLEQKSAASMGVWNKGWRRGCASLLGRRGERKKLVSCVVVAATHVEIVRVLQFFNWPTNLFDSLATRIFSSTVLAFTFRPHSFQPMANIAPLCLNLYLHMHTVRFIRDLHSRQFAPIPLATIW